MTSLLLIVGLFGYNVYSNRQHDRQIANLSLVRQAESNKFFLEVCDRFAIRDEIFLRILQDSYARALTAGERVRAESLLGPIIALRQAQGDCRKQIPEVIKPPTPKP